MEIDEFIEVLDQQTYLFQQLISHQQDLQQAMFNKNHVLAKDSMNTIEGLLIDIKRGEQRREEIFKQMLEKHGMSPETKPLEFMRDPALRRQLIEPFRNFKISVFQSRNINECIRVYSTSHLETMNAIFDDIYPQRRGSTYTAEGQRQDNFDPIIFDHSL